MKRNLAWICLGVVIAAIARTDYSVQPVKDIHINSKMWNLSQCEPMSSEVDYRVDNGDLTRVWSAIERLDFLTQGDSISQTYTETRSF